MNPTYYYTNGNVKIKFTTIEKGIDVYLNAGSDVRNMSKAIVQYNRTVTLNKEYSIDQSLNFVVTVIPKLNSYNTTYSF